MVIDEPIMVAICIALGSVLFMCLGYAIATKNSICAIENVERWMKNIQSDAWISSDIYDEQVQKYEDLLKEYEQYKGCMKALRDSGIFLNEELEE